MLEEKMIYHPQIERDGNDQCNICLVTKNLTWDHVPPQGGINLEPVELRTIFQNIFEEQPKYKISQNGVKFRTICAKCNQDLLGRKYDPFLNEFAKSLCNFIKSSLVLPNIIHLDLKPIPIVKSILGHILSAKLEATISPFEKKVRPIILDENLPIPNDINIFYWIYPYIDTVVIRDIVMPKTRGNYRDFGMFHILKFFPLAFLISDDVSKYNNLDSLTKYQELKYNDLAKIPVNLKNIKPSTWPERVEKGNVVAFGKSGVSSIKAKPKNRTF